MLIKCEIDDFGFERDYGPNVYAKCMRCGNKTNGFSVTHSLVLMRQSCPGGARHRYVEYDGIPDAREQYEPRYRGDPASCLEAAGLELHLRIKAAYRQAVRGSAKRQT